jgi:hypothetical protein
MGLPSGSLTHAISSRPSHSCGGLSPWTPFAVSFV